MDDKIRIINESECHCDDKDEEEKEKARHKIENFIRQLNDSARKLLAQLRVDLVFLFQYYYSKENKYIDRAHD